ncbi:MAG: hypothetical protein KG075_19950 [Alphaproteobacteria bacterium]|nr:hypothetical protein [Alphaproteobacteria bacterium]
MSTPTPVPPRSDVASNWLRILLTEDHRVNQKVAQIMLTKSGHVVDSAQAVQTARRGG